MSALESPRWSQRRWACSILTLFLVQVGLILWVGRREQPLPVRPIFRTALLLAVDEADTRNVAALTGREDPTLLALPSLLGFSGPAWLEFSTPDYQAPEPEEPPYWLPPREASFGTTFSALVATSGIAPPLVADKPVPRLPRYEPNLPQVPLTTRSGLRLEGELARRSLSAPIDLPSWPNHDIVSNTVVQAAVDADGVTVFTALLTRSGLNEADAHALDLAGRAQFQPLRRQDARAGETLTWGRMIFLWHTLPPPITNPPPLP